MRIVISIVLFLQCSVFVLAQDPIPVWNFRQLERNVMQNSSDSIYLINFWATWCKPCVEELPAFVRLDSTLKAKGSKVKVLLVSFDFVKDRETKLRNFLRARGITTSVVVFSDNDMSGSIDRIAKEWSGALPATLIIKPATSKRAFFEQSFQESELQSTLQTFTGE